MLQEGKLDLKHQKGYHFGFLLASMMIDIHSSLVDKKRKLPPRKYMVPTIHDWNKECDRLLLLHLTTPDIKVKSKQQASYRDVWHSPAYIFPYVDVLGGNHLVATASTLGLLPLWITSDIEIHKSRSILWLLSKFIDDKKEGAHIKADEVVSNVMATLKTHFLGHFSRRTVENIICKVFRMHAKKKQ
jgi:hypothetical protein